MGRGTLSFEEDLKQYGIGKDEPTAYVFRKETALSLHEKGTAVDEKPESISLTEKLKTPEIGVVLEKYEGFQQWFNESPAWQKKIVRHGFPYAVALISLANILAQEYITWVDINLVLILYASFEVPITAFLYIKKIDMRIKEDEEWKRYRKNQLCTIGLGIFYILIFLVFNYIRVF